MGGRAYVMPSDRIGSDVLRCVGGGADVAPPSPAAPMDYFGHPLKPGEPVEKVQRVLNALLRDQIGSS